LEELAVEKETAVVEGRSCGSGEQALAAAVAAEVVVVVVVEAANRGAAAVDAAERAVEEEAVVGCFAEEAVPVPTFY
jgi:hypothetical protein